MINKNAEPPGTVFPQIAESYRGLGRSSGGDVGGAGVQSLLSGVYAGVSCLLFSPDS